MSLDLYYLGWQLDPGSIAIWRDVDDHLLAAWLWVCEDLSQSYPQLGHDSVNQFVLPAALPCCHQHRFYDPLHACKGL